MPSFHGATPHNRRRSTTRSQRQGVTRADWSKGWSTKVSSYRKIDNFYEIVVEPPNEILILVFVKQKRFMSLALQMSQNLPFFSSQIIFKRFATWMARSASEMTYIVSGGTLNSTHSLTWMARVSSEWLKVTFAPSSFTRGSIILGI